tara:strand:- start:523 stop:1887 length:1365 start_codon:yes stop_codon:yes gene_type:complete
MAINFLDNIQLNQNQLLGVRIENVTSNPAIANGGDIIFNSTDKKLKYYNESSWISLPDLGGISGEGEIGAIPVFTKNTVISSSSLTVSGETLSSGYSTTSVKSLYIQGSILDTASRSGTSGQILSSKGLSGIDWIDAPVGYTKWILSDGRNTQDVSDGNTVVIGGGTNITTTVSETDTVRIDLDESITLAGELTVQGAGQSSFAGPVTIPATPTAGTDAASKAYVDDVTAGGLIYQGGYNANTNTPNLETPNPNKILKGWTYTVTVEGLFFTEQVRVGDLLIAEQDAPTTLQDWTTVQNNIDLATTEQIGIGNVIQPLPLQTNLKGINVTYNKPGTATVGLDFDELVDKGAKTTTNDFVILNSQDPETRKNNYKLTLAELAQYVGGGNSFAGSSASGTSHVFTHNLGSLDVIVQIFDNVTSETVYANVDRTSTSVVTVTTSKSANIRCLVQKVG